MKKGFSIRKVEAAALLAVAIAVAVVIVALSVVYSHEKSKNRAALATTTGPSVASTYEPFTTSTPKEPWQLYRLPDSLSPVSYNVTLWPRLTPNDDNVYIFTGNSTVVFKCVKETDLILIHSNMLNLTVTEGHHAVLRGLDGAPAPSLSRTWLEVPTQYLVVQLNGPLSVGRRYELYTGFVGELADDLKGFYVSKYNIGGQQNVLAVSQLQPTDARKVFPCFDEPAMKAVFHVTLIHPPGTVALSNSMNYDPVNVTMDGQDLLRTSYEPTKVMSSYLLAFAVCEFGFRWAKLADNTLIRVWARKKAIESGEGDYALEKTKTVLVFFQDYCNFSYPLPKSDQIAIPDFQAVAMENWGLVMYYEPTLLYNPAVPTTELKEQVVSIISHELAHMWFGNLVTMKWWNELWLNEGFATYLSYLGSDYTEPKLNMSDLFVMKEIFPVMESDAFGSSRPLSCKEEDVVTPKDINRMFNSITYSKGAAVLRMLSDFISEDAFSKGLHTYLKEFAYNSATYKDLWRHLQMAVENAGVKLPFPVDTIMNCWILQIGFPLVTFNTKTGTVSQQHFLLDTDSATLKTYTWIVPVKWSKNGGAEQQFWLLEKEGKILEETNPDMVLDTNDWMLANINVKGFYRVNYDSDNWERLLARLNSNPQDIPLINRAQIINDAFTLARVKVVNITLALKTTRFLDKEHEYMPWQMACKNLEYIFLMFDRSEVYGPILAYMKRKVTPLFNYLKNVTANWTKNLEKQTDQYNQVNAIKLACNTGVNGCKELTSSWFREWMENPHNNTISPNLRTAVYCNAIASGGPEEWDFAWSMVQKAMLATDVDSLLHGMSCTKIPWLLNRYLQYCLDLKTIGEHNLISAMYHITNNPVGLSVAWNFIQTHWEEMVTDYTDGLTALIHGLSRRFSTEFEYKQLLQLKDRAEHQGKEVAAVDVALETTKTNMDWVALHKDQVFEWFSNEVSSG